MEKKELKLSEVIEEYYSEQLQTMLFEELNQRLQEGKKIILSIKGVVE